MYGCTVIVVATYLMILTQLFLFKSNGIELHYELDCIHWKNSSIGFWFKAINKPILKQVEENRVDRWFLRDVLLGWRNNLILSATLESSFGPAFLVNAQQSCIKICFCGLRKTLLISLPFTIQLHNEVVFRTKLLLQCAVLCVHPHTLVNKNRVTDRNTHPQTHNVRAAEC